MTSVHILPSLFRKKIIQRTHHNHCISLAFPSSYHTQDIIGYVPRHVVNGSGGRMRPDHRRFGQFQHLAGGVIRGVAYINKHAKTVHLRHKGTSERAARTIRGITPRKIKLGRPQSAPLWFRWGKDSSRVRECVVTAMCESHVPHTKVVDLTEGAQ